MSISVAGNNRHINLVGLNEEQFYFVVSPESP